MTIESVWIDAQGTAHDIARMRDYHLVNTLRHLERDAINHYRCDGGVDQSWRDFVHEKYPLLEAEARGRKLMW